LDRLWRKQLTENGEIDAKQELQNFLQPVAEVEDEMKPIITQYYADTFSAVDVFNQQLGFIHYKAKTRKPELIWLMGILRICLVNAWALYQEHNKIKQQLDDESSLKDFIKSVSLSLMNRKQ
jgi:hypothetical protein